MNSGLLSRRALPSAAGLSTAALGTPANLVVIPSAPDPEGIVSDARRLGRHQGTAVDPDDADGLVPQGPFDLILDQSIGEGAARNDPVLAGTSLVRQVQVN